LTFPQVDNFQPSTLAGCYTCTSAELVLWQSRGALPVCGKEQTRRSTSRLCQLPDSSRKALWSAWRNTQFVFRTRNVKSGLAHASGTRSNRSAQPHQPAKTRNDATTRASCNTPRSKVTIANRTQTWADACLEGRCEERK